MWRHPTAFFSRDRNSFSLTHRHTSKKTRSAATSHSTPIDPRTGPEHLLQLFIVCFAAHIISNLEHVGSRDRKGRGSGRRASALAGRRGHISSSTAKGSSGASRRQPRRCLVRRRREEEQPVRRCSNVALQVRNDNGATTAARPMTTTTTKTTRMKASVARFVDPDNASTRPRRLPLPPASYGLTAPPTLGPVLSRPRRRRSFR